MIRCGHEVAQWVGALCSKPEGRGFGYRGCHWNFALTSSFRPYNGSGVDSANDRNEHYVYCVEVKAADA